MVDFVGLCRAARELPGPETRDQLWSAWFALPAWHFIAAPSPMGPLPFSNFVHGQRCVLGFTTAARADEHARITQVGPPLTLTPEATMPKVPVLRSYGVFGFLVDIGPDGFHTSLDQLWAMFHRFRMPPAAPPMPTPQQGPVPGTVEWWLALPAWHLVVSRADPMLPDFADTGGELVAQVYSSAQAAARFAGSAPISVLPPARVLALLADVELVKYVRFDDQLMVDLIDLGLRAASRR